MCFLGGQIQVHYFLPCSLMLCVGTVMLWKRNSFKNCTNVYIEIVKFGGRIKDWITCLHYITKSNLPLTEPEIPFNCKRGWWKDSHWARVLGIFSQGIHMYFPFFFFTFLAVLGIELRTSHIFVLPLRYTLSPFSPPPPFIFVVIGTPLKIFLQYTLKMFLLIMWSMYNVSMFETISEFHSFVQLMC